jgi:predicted RNA-binding protein (virulence factor B family)
LYQAADFIFALTMVNIRRFWLSSSLILSLLAHQGLSMVFEDTDAPDAVKSLFERGDQSNEDAAFSVFDRLSKDSYYWSGMVSPG